MSIFGVILVHIFPAFSRIQTEYAVNKLALSLENAEYSLNFLSISDRKAASRHTVYDFRYSKY